MIFVVELKFTIKLENNSNEEKLSQKIILVPLTFFIRSMLTTLNKTHFTKYVACFASGEVKDTTYMEQSVQHYFQYKFMYKMDYNHCNHVAVYQICCTSILHTQSLLLAPCRIHHCLHHQVSVGRRAGLMEQM